MEEISGPQAVAQPLHTRAGIAVDFRMKDAFVEAEPESARKPAISCLHN